MATSARCLNRQEKHTASPTVIWTMEGASQTRNADLSHWYVWELPAHLSLSVWRGPLNAHQLAQRNFALEKEIKEQCVPSELYNYSYTLILFVVSEEVILNSLSPLPFYLFLQPWSSRATRLHGILSPDLLSRLLLRWGVPGSPPEYCPECKNLQNYLKDSKCFRRWANCVRRDQWLFGRRV